jgi:hypothetical protein
MLNLNLLGFIKVKFCVNLSYFFEMIEIIADILVNTLALQGPCSLMAETFEIDMFYGCSDDIEYFFEAL